MCCSICNALGNCLGHIVYNSEKLASCFALAAVVWCLITTLLVILAIGTGLGYNYCVVDFKGKPTPKAVDSIISQPSNRSLRFPYRLARSGVADVPDPLDISGMSGLGGSFGLDTPVNLTESDTLANKAELPREAARRRGVVGQDDQPDSQQKYDWIRRFEKTNTRNSSKENISNKDRTVLVPWHLRSEFIALLKKIKEESNRKNRLYRVTIPF